MTSFPPRSAPGERSGRALAVVAVAAAFAGACSGSSKTKVDFSLLCEDGAFTPAGSLACADTFDAQAANPTGIAGIITSGLCGGSLVWLAETVGREFLCLYDPATKTLTGTLEVTDSGGQCWGSVPDSMLGCFHSDDYADAGADGGNPAVCSNGELIERGDASCAPTPTAEGMGMFLGFLGSSGCCGGYFVVVEQRSDFSVTCLYDPAPPMNLLGARVESETNVSCSGVGATVPEECSRVQVLSASSQATPSCGHSGAGGTGG